MGIVPISIKKIKILLILVLFFLLVIFTIILLLPSNVIISKTILINASKEKVAAQIDDFTSWKNWFPLFQNKNITTHITRKDDSDYATIANASKTLEFVLYQKNVDTTNVILKGNYISQTYQFTLLKKGEQTQITWNIAFTFKKFSIKKFAGIFMDQVKNQQYEEILKNLKSKIELSN